MATADTPEKNPPPYIPFSTFGNLVERLKNTAIPSKIDNSVLPNLAGGLRGQVRSALRFMGLTDPTDHVNTSFRELVQAHGTDTWSSSLGSVIDIAYQPILDDLDLTTATPAQLANKFKTVGVSGQMAEKSIRFLLAAFESAGRQFSPHLLARGGMSVTKPRRPPKGKIPSREREQNGGEEEHEETPSTRQQPGSRVRSFSFPIPGEPDIRVVVPEGLDDHDAWEMVDATLRSYIGLNQKAKARAAGREGAQQ